ncbi:MAG: tetratricopeptide repeat protein [Candidatus Thermoplasmatota archaeon]
MALFGGKKEKKSKAIAKIEEIIDEADKCLGQGDFDAAAREYKRAYRYLSSEDALSQAPNDASALYTRTGHGFYEVEEIDRAIACFDKATQFDPKNVDAWLSKGIAHMKTGEMLTYAVLCFNEVLKLKPKSGEALEYKAEALALDDRKDEAIEAYKQLVALFPDNPKYNEKLEELAPVTIETLDAILAKEPNNTDALAKKAELHLKDGKKEDAVEDYLRLGKLTRDPEWYEKVLELKGDSLRALSGLLEMDPQNLNYMIRHAEILRGKGRTADAIEVYFRMAELEPENPAHYEKVLELNPHNLTAMERILAHQPENSGIRAKRAEELLGQGRREEALTEYEELARREPANPLWKEKIVALKPDELPGVEAALSRKPKDQALLQKKAALLEARGEKEEALKVWRLLYNLAPKKLEYIEALLRYTPKDANLLTAKGDLAYEQGAFEKALEAFDELSALTQNDESVWHNKGAVLYQMQRYEEAIACFDHLLSINPDDTLAYLTKGVALYRLRRWDDAISALNNVVKREMNEAAAWYYKACAEAMKGNMKLVIPFLKRSIELDEDYRERAKEEEAFKMMQGTEEFQAAVG